MVQEAYIGYILKILAFIGEDPTSESKLINKLIKIFHVIINTTLLMLVLMYPFQNSDGFTIGTISELVIGFVTTIHIASKILVLTYYKDELKELLTITEEFWEVKNLSEEVVEKIKKMYKYLRVVTLSFTVGAIIAANAFVIFYLIFGELLFFCYIPNKYFLTRDVIAYGEFALTYISLLLLLGFDGLFMFLCYKSVTQLTMIKYKIENLMEFKHPDYVFNQCVEKHILILQFCAKLNRIYSAYFIVQYMMALLTIGIEMFMFMDASAGLVDLIKPSTYIEVIVIQFVGCYCILSQELNSSVSTLPQYIYNSHWYNGNLKLAKKIMIFLTVSQREFVLKAGGIADINLAVVTNLLKTSFSILTFLHAMQDKKAN